MEKQVLLFGACYYSGLIGLARWWRQRSGPRLLILNYHRATGGDLRRHLLYLKRSYRMMHLEEALEELYAPPGQAGRQVADRRTPLVLTFDDGYHDNYTYGFALARELQAPITIFLIPGYIESGGCFWWLAGDLFVQHARAENVCIEGRRYHLDRQGDREQLARAIYTRACQARSVAEREAFLEMVRELLDVPPAVVFEEATALKWAEIREMEESGWVSFGAHTMHHPVLACLTDSTEVQREVSACREVLGQRLGHAIRTFAYPLGGGEHIGKEGLRAVREAGYEWAVTTIYGVNSPRCDPWRLRRIKGDVKRHWLIMAGDTSGLRNFFMPLILYNSIIMSVGKRIVSKPFRLLLSGCRRLSGRAQSTAP